MSASSAKPAVEIVRVTSVDDLPALATLAAIALANDPFKAFHERHTGKSWYDHNIERLKVALADPDRFFVFKAVVQHNGDLGSEGEIIGFSQWYVGFLEVPKTDPFAKRPEDRFHESPTFDVGVGNVGLVGGEVTTATSTTKEKAKPFYHDPHEELTRKLSNSYIRAIRGKKHVYLRNLFVHPNHQRRGLGQKLLDWGLRVADEGKIVSWLFARPAGSGLYERNGFRTVSTIEFEDEDMRPTTSFSMLRGPVPLPKSN